MRKDARAWRPASSGLRAAEGYFVRLLSWSLPALSLTLIGLAGCTSLKLNKGAPTAPGPTGGSSPAKFPSDPIIGAPPPAPAVAAVPAGGSQAVIAGRVLDEYGRPANNSYVRLTAVGEKEGGTPIDVAATADGYFTIQNLKQGVDYKLIARTKTGETLIAGQTQTSAPNIHVVIKMSRELAGATTPDVPGHVGDTLKTPPKTSALGRPEPLPTWAPGAKSDGGAPGLSVEHDVPAIRVPVPTGEPKKDAPAGPIASDKGLAWPPTLDMGPKTPAVKPLIPAITPDTRPGSATTLGPARVPSCVFIGRQLINFSLNDINGQPWEFTKHRTGKLVLLDFWGTHCIPCRQTLPEVRDLDAKYRAQGLEVIGLAYETSGTPEERAYRVNEVAKRLKLNYRQLLGSASACPVAGQLHIEGIPTLILVDQNGWILWRKTGPLTRVDLDELERWIQRRLPVKS